MPASTSRLSLLTPASPSWRRSRSASPSTAGRSSDVKRRFQRAVPSVWLITAALAGSTAHADWLVLKDGSRVETKGGWQIDKGVVIFHLSNGTLASLRSAEVDLEASAAATARAAAPTPPAKPTP